MLRKTTLFCTGYSTAISQFAVCRQPWNEYINLLTKSDTKPFHTSLHDKPAYRGRKKGREGWVFGQQVQLHYHLFPDEHIVTNLTRWRQGATVGDISLQQFRNAQPFDIGKKDELGHNNPPPEVYMKLNYKNPATFSRFLTRTGHMYPNDILPLNPEAVKKIRYAKTQAIRLGLYPRSGNPFWFRSQQFRPKPYRESYDPTTYSTKETMEHFAYNWTQTERIRTYFKQLSEAHRGNAAGHRGGTSEHRQQSHGYSKENNNALSLVRRSTYGAKNIERSEKNTTVPGLMSVKGMKKKFHNLYSSVSTKRMGFGNPVLGIKKV